MGEGWPALSLQELKNLTLCSKGEGVISWVEKQLGVFGRGCQLQDRGRDKDGLSSCDWYCLGQYGRLVGSTLCVLD